MDWMSSIIPAELARTTAGSLGVFTVLLWPHLKRLETAMAVQIGGAIAFGVYFAVGGLGTAAACSAVAGCQLFVRAVIKDRALVILLTAESAVLLVLFAVCTWQGLSSCLALAGGLLGSVARTRTTTTAMKRGFLIAAPAWLAHNLLIRSSFGLLVDAVSIVSHLGSFVAGHRGRRKLRERSARMLPLCKQPSHFATAVTSCSIARAA